jgi:hypothetical protein
MSKCYQKYNRYGFLLDDVVVDGDYQCFGVYSHEEHDVGEDSRATCAHHEFLGEDSFKGWVCKVLEEGDE